MISVVIPLYNKERSITTTLLSVLNQSYVDWELIIVNDGSTDKSADVVCDFIHALDSKEFTEKKIRLIYQDNAGVSSARNKGIVEAKGEYVAFLDGDDLWTNDYLETLNQLILDYPDAGIYCIGYRCLTGTVIPKEELSQARVYKSYRGRIDNPWSGNLDLLTSSCCSNRQLLLDVGMFDERITHGEDLDLFWRLVLAEGVVVDEKCCAYYRLDAENRAMLIVPALEKHMVYYIDKYSVYRAKNIDFRRFFDSQMIYQLYPYLLDKRYSKEALKIARQFDYSLLKWSMHFRMLFPRLYYILRKYLGK